MMKKTLSLLLAALLLLLGACGKKSTPVWDVKSLTEAMLSSDAFSTELNELSASKAAVFYELNESLIEDAVMYHASGTNQEQLAIFTAKDEKSAEEITASLRSQLELWAKTEANYAPAEVSKLKDAVLERMDRFVLLVVAADGAKARAVLEGK